MNHPATFGRAVRRTLLGACALAGLPVLGVACLDRPVVPATPTITARVSQSVKQTAVNAIDLLFLIDNSSSMADKQTILASAVPALFNRLIHPNCIDSKTGTTMATPDNSGNCPTGTELEFNPVASIHIGIVSSSLGSHGVAGVCDDGASGAPADSHNNDNGRLLTRGSMPNSGFLDWATGGADDTGGSFGGAVKEVGQHGCGYEAQLEAPYRFLIDPNPPEKVEVVENNGNKLIQVSGTDNTILAQRAAFLRPDSLVAVIMITDENDCSIDEQAGQAWLSLAPAQSDLATLLGPGTDPCLTNPQDPCCFNCAQDPPSGCKSAKDYKNCVDGEGNLRTFTAAEDPSNLRCFHQKQRYGIDFLYPIDRYVKGYTEPRIRDRDGADKPNPLFSDLTCPAGTANCTPKAQRDKALVFVAGIVGVPWQDIALDVNKPEAGYKSTAEGDFPWDLILGNPSANVPPTDPLMVESVEPRTAVQTASPMGSKAIPNDNFDALPTANPVNGHEWDTSKIFPQAKSDLQYACIFKLPQSRSCEGATTDCDCIDFTAKHNGTGPNDFKSPLCQNDQGAFGTTQYRAKGYPGIRELQVLQGLQKQAIVASVCPASMDGKPTDPGYGYNPAVQTLINRLKEALRGKCLPRTIVKDEVTHQYPCIIYEGFDPANGASCDCEGDKTYLNRKANNTPPDQLPPEVKGKSCICQIQPVAEEYMRDCQTNAALETSSSRNAVGWCYVDPAQEIESDSARAGACAVVSKCPSTNKRLIRFAGQGHIGEPRPGAEAVILCQEATFAKEGTIIDKPCE